ncbi:MAG: Pvc16 family protein, partial [Pseudomonadota bacterium]
PGLSQLTVEIANLGAEDVAQIWGNMGGRYLPSVLYKVRSVVIDGNVLRQVEPLVRAPGQAVTPEAV